MSNTGGTQLPKQHFGPNQQFPAEHPTYQFVDPASNMDAPVGPKLQKLIDSIGTAKKEDYDQTDLLWTTTGQSVPMSAEEIAELEQQLVDADPYAQTDPVVYGLDGGEGLDSLAQTLEAPLIGSLIAANRAAAAIEETKTNYEPESILEQIQAEDTQHVSPTPSFADLQAFTADMIQEDIDAMEYRLSEIASNVGTTWNNMSETGEIDLLYATSISFLVVITVAIVAALFSYHRMLKQPVKAGGARPSMRAMASSIFGGAAQGNGNDPENDAATGDNDEQQPRGLAEMAFDMLASPFSALRRQANGGDAGSNPNNEISRLSLQYSSANMSEEESSSLINILDRKKYNERIQATRSADDHPQPSSFFEKISTGSNTDSDLRVVRFDGGAAKEMDSNEAFKDEDSLPKFRKPVPSKHQLSQQQMASDAANQLRLQQQQQLLLFEDFSSEQEGRATMDTMIMGELYQHKQQQSLQAYLGQTNFLSEDRIHQHQTETVVNQSMASTQEASMYMAAASEDCLPLDASTPKQAATPSSDSIYEKQRQYYFGGDQQQEENTAKLSTGKKFQDDCKQVETLDTLQFNEDSASGLLDGLEPADGASGKAQAKPVNVSISTNQPLDAIVELNYEASSDEQELIEEAVEV